MRLLITVPIAMLASGCDSPGLQPPDDNVVNATVRAEVAPPGALGDESVNYPEGSITPAERGLIYDVENQSPGQVVQAYANLLEQRRFEDAYRMWDPAAANVSAEQFAKRFERYDTIDAEVGAVAPPEGAAGSIYDDVQLTLTGKTKSGENYTMTGPVTLRRVNDVPGSTAEQRRWRIVKTVLTANPQAAEALVTG